MTNTITNKLSNSEYENLIAKSFNKKIIKEKTIVSGKIISIENDVVTIDVGLKSEGRVALNEFTRPGQNAEINIGDTFEVFIEDNFNWVFLLSSNKYLYIILPFILILGFIFKKYKNKLKLEQWAIEEEIDNLNEV